jgi:hypothetical protein
MSEAKSQTDREKIENRLDLEAHIMDEVTRSDEKISNIFGGKYIPGLVDTEVIVYLNDCAFDHDRVSIINAAMNHPQMNIRLSSLSNFPVEEEDSSAFLVFQIP